MVGVGAPPPGAARAGSLPSKPPLDGAWWNKESSLYLEPSLNEDSLEASRGFTLGHPSALARGHTPAEPSEIQSPPLANPPAPDGVEWDEAQKSQGKLKSLAECCDPQKGASRLPPKMPRGWGSEECGGPRMGSS